MLKKQLESRIFDQDRRICELEEFEKIGDEKLLEAYEIVDAKQKVINDIKKLLNNKK